MPSIRRYAQSLLALAALCGAFHAACAAPAPRGPSTPEERARVVALAAESRKDPLTVSAANEAWLEQWVTEVPDIMFKPEAVARWCVRSAKGEMRKVVRFQFSASALAYQLEHNLPDPQKAEDVRAVDLAGLDGVLAAYETVLAKDPGSRSPKMDEALARRGKGELAAFAAELAK
jgi:hypothetical protein